MVCLHVDKHLASDGSITSLVSVHFSQISTEQTESTLSQPALPSTGSRSDHEQTLRQSKLQGSEQGETNRGHCLHGVGGLVPKAVRRISRGYPLKLCSGTIMCSAEATTPSTIRVPVRAAVSTRKVLTMSANLVHLSDIRKYLCVDP